jgi:hypothetical protein
LNVSYVIRMAYQSKIRDGLRISLRVEFNLFRVDLAIVSFKNGMSEYWSGWKVSQEVETIFFKNMDIIDSDHIGYLEASNGEEDHDLEN